jgi:hypothetical protein
MKEKINQLARNSKNKNISDLYRETNNFKMGYQVNNNIVKDKNDDLLADLYNKHYIES